MHAKPNIDKELVARDAGSSPGGDTDGGGGKGRGGRRGFGLAHTARIECLRLAGSVRRYIIGRVHALNVKPPLPGAR
jgi:hypothetical protein